MLGLTLHGSACALLLLACLCPAVRATRHRAAQRPAAGPVAASLAGSHPHDVTVPPSDGHHEGEGHGHDHGHGHDRTAPADGHGGEEHAASPEAHSHGGDGGDGHDGGGGHDGHADGHADGHQEGHHGHGQKMGQGAHSVAVGLLTTVVMVPLVLWMALSDGLIGELTIRMIDTFISIFLAVLWYSAFEQFLDTFKVASWFPHGREVVCLAQVIVLYIIAIGVAWLWRDKQLSLTTFCVCGAHYIAFAGIGASGGAQSSFSTMSEQAWSPLLSFFFIVLAFGFIALLFFADWFLWRHEKTGEKEYNKSIDCMEVDIAGLVTSFLITQAVRHTITGKYPPTHHLLLFLGTSPREHTETQRSLMLIWSVCLTGAAAFLLPIVDVSAHQRGNAWAKRGARFLKVMIIMLVAWGYLLWGQWEFYENFFDGDPMFGHMVFACLCTFSALLVLYSMAFLQGRVHGSAATETNNITVSGISLVAAWSWEECFAIAFDVIGEEYQVGYGGLVPKIVMAIVIPCVLLPTYVKHVRVKAIKVEEKEEEENEHRILEGVQRSRLRLLSPTASEARAPDDESSSTRSKEHTNDAQGA